MLAHAQINPADSHRQLSAAEIDRKVYGRFQWHARGTGRCWPGDRCIARDTGLTEEQVSQSILRQWDDGEIGIEYHGRRRYILIAQNAGIAQSELSYKKNELKEVIQEETTTAQPPLTQDVVVSSFSFLPEFVSRIDVALCVPEGLPQPPAVHVATIPRPEPTKPTRTTPEVRRATSNTIPTRTTPVRPWNRRLAARLMAAGISTPIAQELVQDYPCDMIRRQLQVLDRRKPKDRAATLVASIRGYWCDPPGRPKTRKPSSRPEVNARL